MNNNALVTGASKRIGRAISLELAQKGWNIAIHFNTSKGEAETLYKEITSLGVQAVLVQGNLENPDEINSIFERARQKLGPINCLINNASLFEPDLIDDITQASFIRHMTTNLLSPALLTQALAAQPDLDFSEKSNIINIIDQRVMMLGSDFVSYTLSKSALWTLTQTSAMSLAPNVRVNAIGPGPTLASKRQDPAQFERQCHQVPLQHGATAAEIAKGVAFLLDAPSITGEFIAMDGGQHLPSSIVTEEE